MTRLASWMGVGARCALALAAPGCTFLAPQPDHARFYVLTSAGVDGVGAATPASSANPGQMTVGVGPVTLPAYLDRSQVVTRVSANRLELSGENRWAEPLKSSFSRILAQNLATLLGTQQVVVYPWLRPPRIDYQVKVDVERFETNANGTSDLVASWKILDPATGTVLASSTTSVAEPIDSKDEGAAAQSLSRAVAALSRQIATSLAQVTAERQAAEPSS